MRKNLRLRSIPCQTSTSERSPCLARTKPRPQQLVSRLIQQKIPFSAIIGSEDIIAIGAQKALSAAGIERPVIGCNNSVLAECATPALTSIDNRLDIICPAAVDVLTKILDDGSHSAPNQTVFPAIIEYRESFPE